MGLCVFSGPSWKDDSLNEINPESVIENAYKMRNQCVPYCSQKKSEEVLSQVSTNKLELSFYSLSPSL